MESQEVVCLGPRLPIKQLHCGSTVHTLHATLSILWCVDMRSLSQHMRMVLSGESERAGEVYIVQCMCTLRGSMHVLCMCCICNGELFFSQMLYHVPSISTEYINSADS